MHRLVHAQTLTVRPVQHRTPLAGHLLLIHQGLEGHIIGLRGGLESGEQVTQREPDPGHDHRPGLDAAQAVDPLLLRESLQDVLDADLSRCLAFAVDNDIPGPGLQCVGIACRIFLAGTELVEIVVAGHVFVASRLEVVPVRGIDEAAHRRSPARHLDQGRGGTGDHADAQGRRRLEKRAPPGVVRGVGNFGRTDIGGLLDQHGWVLNRVSPIRPVKSCFDFTWILHPICGFFVPATAQARWRRRMSRPSRALATRRPGAHRSRQRRQAMPTRQKSAGSGRFGRLSG